MEELILKLSDIKNKSPKRFPRGFVVLCCIYSTIGLHSCAPKPKEVLQYFDDGSVQRRHFEVNGQKQGLMIDYFGDGTISGERTFVNDLQEGRAVWYFPNGKKKESQEYLNGILSGPDSLWLENGALQRVIYFENGKKHGPMRSWSAAGELILEVIYERDSLISVNMTLAKQDTSIQMQ